MNYFMYILLHSYLSMEVVSNEEQVLILMKEDLPDYLQNVLLVCGYDKMSAIAKMMCLQT